jgi:hypothetical protein
MPFKSEKQRRYLWLKHPDIAKRWADEYPNQKKLPMYAEPKSESGEKQSATQILNAVLPNYLRKFANSVPTRTYDANIKESDSKQEYVKLPEKHGPTFAGEVETQAVTKPSEDGGNDKCAPTPEKQDQMTADALFKKLSVVLSPVLMQEIENEQAAQQAREAARMPQNVGIKRLPPAVNSILPPMGMAQAAPNPGQTQPAQPQPQTGQLASVGGGSSPNANPINSFGGLSSTGDINGNAALGTQNSVGGEKMAGGNNPILSWLMSIDNVNIPDPEDLDYDERMKAAGSPAWQRSAGKNDEGGLNAKGRASYNRATGGNLKAPVTESKPKGDRAKRQNSFCSRMCGMKKHETGSKTKKDPESRINKALRKWNCKCANCAGQPFEVAKSASLDRMLASALVSAGGGLALGAYPGWQLQQASARAGNPEFVNSFVGRIPIALGGALSGGVYNYLRERADAEAEAKKQQAVAGAH